MADFSGMIKAIKDWAVSRFLTEIPVGSTTNVGGVKADGTTITIDSDGTIHASGGGGGTGTTDYNALENKPSIGGVTLSGDRTPAELGIQPIGSYVTNSEMEDYAQPKGEYLTGETDPTVPSWAKEPSKPTYTASEVGADVAGSAEQALDYAKSYTDSKVPTKTSQLENDSGFLKSATALDSYEEIMANTASGKFAGALGVKEGLNMLNDSLVKIDPSFLVELINPDLSSYIAPTIYSSRVTSLIGGYKQIDNVVFINIRAVTNIESSNSSSWRLFSDIPSTDYPIPLSSVLTRTDGDAIGGMCSEYGGSITMRNIASFSKGYFITIKGYYTV